MADIGPPQVVVGVGASAGGIDPTCTVLGGLPADLRAAVLVVVHISADAPSVLDHILARCGPLPVTFAQDGETVRTGRVYVAPAGTHMTVADDKLRLNRGPTVNAVRPSIDVLFESMAVAYGANAVGVVLSGTRSDGAAGLHAITAAGGYGIVQDPADALFPGMPASAKKLAAPDEIAVAGRIGGLVAKKVAELGDHDNHHDLDPADAMVDPIGAEEFPEGDPSGLVCPECGGALWEQSGRPLAFRCRIGHAYTYDSLAGRQSQRLEELLWSAVVALEERADLFTRMAGRLTGRATTVTRMRYEKDASDATANARRLRSIVMGLQDPPAPGVA